MKKAYRILLLAAFMVMTGIAQMNAQGITSPYSKFGYGLLGDGATGIQRTMGGVGYAMQNGRLVNAMNPASYAATDTLTFLFDMGLDFTQLWSKDGENTGNAFGGGLDYISMQFPIGKNMGASIGVVPFSSVGYAYSKTIDNGVDNRSGEGGINQLYGGYAIRPINGLSVGFNASYMFGTIVNDVIAQNATSGSVTLYERMISIKDWSLQFGLQYAYNINRRNRLTVGAVYTLGKALHGDTWGTYYDTQDQQVVSTDTISMGKGDKYTIPAAYGLGLSYTWNNRFTAEVDVTYQQWTKAKFAPLPSFDLDGTTLDFNDRIRVGMGLSYQPDDRGGYGKRITYRAGAYYNRDYMNIRGNSVRDYGVGVGVSLPVPNGKTLINLGVEYKRRESSPSKLVTEDYLNITFGVTFNEMWFWQNKIR